MNISNVFNNYDFIKLDEIKISEETKIVILYARFMYNSDVKWVMDNHTHSYYELHFPIQGSCSWIMRDNSSETLTPGSYLLIHPNTEHQFNDHSNDFFRLSIAFEIQHNNKVLSIDDKFLHHETTKETRQLLDRIVSEYTSRELGYNNLVSYYIHTVIIELLRSNPSIMLEAKKQSEPDKNILNEALTYIRTNISSDITTEDVAKHVNLSSRQLNRIFNQSVNMTISGFIRNERIMRVREHLKKTTLSLREIASLTGFNDEYVLCKAFKKATGSTPGKYKSDKQKKNR